MADIWTRRLEAVRQRMAVDGVDVLALVPGPNLTYLTGATLHLMERPAAVLIPVDGTPLAVLPGLEVPTWRETSRLEAEVVAWSDSEGPEAAFRSAVASMAKVRTLAVETLRMRVQEYGLLVAPLEGVKVLAAEQVIQPVRARKDETEVAAIRAAVEVCERALAEVVDGIRPGMTEAEIAARLVRALLDRGEADVPMRPAVLSGPNSALPHGSPGSRRIAAGDALLFDFVCTVQGYYADITRTFVVGAEPEPWFREIYEVVLQANAAARAAVRPGATYADIDRAAREVIEGAGYGSYFLHRTGHGLGLEVHEPPSLSAAEEGSLAAGHVITIEPGIYLPGRGGVRIEDDVLVTDDGCQTLTSYPRELLVIAR